MQSYLGRLSIRTFATSTRRASNAAMNAATMNPNVTLAGVVDAAHHHVSQVDLDAVNFEEAKKLMSEEHKILGYRPPHDSLAAQAQRAASKHPDAPGALHGNIAELKRLAADDAARVEAARGNPPPANAAHREIDLHGGLSSIGQVEASKLMSAEHKALGYRPPPNSLAAQAQRVAALHPNTKPHIDPAILTDAAVKDAARILAERGAQQNVDFSTVTKEEASHMQSIEAKMLSGGSTKGTAAATAQSLADSAANPPA